MRKLVLCIAVVAMLLPSCKKINEELDSLNNRLDKLKEAIPTIEEQIESINSQLTSLKATDEAVKEQIAELEKSDVATATEIAGLMAKDTALEKSIADLQSYVDTQIENAKSEAAAAYATIEQYNNIVVKLNALQNSTNKLGEELTAKINAEVKSLTNKITDLENRLKVVEDKVENLLARIQSVSYIPEYADGKAKVKYNPETTMYQVNLDFEVTPQNVVNDLAVIWEDVLSVKAVYSKTRAVSFIGMPIISFCADEVNGVISIVASGENLSNEFFKNEQSANVRLSISDGNINVVSEYISMTFGFKVGDYLEIEGVGGIVFETDGINGKMFSVDSATARWGLYGVATGATDVNDGRANVETMKFNGFFENSPAFVWCEELGEGWYLPAINELKSIYNVRNIVSLSLEQISSKTLSDYHWSSTEGNEEYAYKLHFPSGDTNDYFYKYHTFNVRAVYAF